MSKVADAVSGNWVDLYAPASWRPYLRMGRFDRPIGWWLLLLPCWQGVALALIAGGWKPQVLWLVPLFWVGAMVMRGAGCCLNDIVDRDIDARVARTRSRPLPSGQIRLWQAALFMGVLCLIGLAVLLSMNRAAIWLGLASLLPVVIYPFMKRLTYWPQLFLGIAFNWGALLGWTALEGRLALPALFLYLGGICWTIGYDTIYAHQDAEDDALIGVKSTALLFGSKTRHWLALFYGLAWGLTLAATLSAGGRAWQVLLAMLPYGLHLIWQVWRFELNAPRLVLRLFKSNRLAGLLLLGGLLGLVGFGYSP